MQAARYPVCRAVRSLSWVRRSHGHAGRQFGLSMRTLPNHDRSLIQINHQYVRQSRYLPSLPLHACANNKSCLELSSEYEFSLELNLCIILHTWSFGFYIARRCANSAGQ
ncbi:hypothetical protein DAI22_11g100100 [Oryza sativa Japonica Group]|nr:hypothetical protein DAI22_11g100100 [Oryza sativa Japonica Group]